MGVEIALLAGRLLSCFRRPMVFLSRNISPSNMCLFSTEKEITVIIIIQNMCPYPSNPFQQIVESKERTRCTRNKFSFIPSPYCLLHVIDPSIWMPGKGREANSFPRAKLEENCELRGTDNVQGQISEHIFKVKWRVLCLLSFKYFLQYASSASLSYVNHVKVFQLASKISTSFNSDFASVESICLRKKYTILR